MASKLRIPLTFLSADQPITKRFELHDGQVISDARPVKHLTSHIATVASISDFHKALAKAAASGKCLLKGSLTKPLLNESRAGKTNTKASTRWICFDVDGTEAIQTAEDFIYKILPKAFHKTSYIEQASASQGLVRNRGFSAHIFFITRQTSSPTLLKSWLHHLNLDNDLLRNELSLTSTGASLKYKLDLTLADNSRLIYIAPPSIGHGIVDNFEGPRIRYVKKQNVAVNWSAPPKLDFAALEQETLKALQKAAGIRIKTPRYSVHKGETVLRLSSTQKTRVTEWRENAAGMIQLNLHNKVTDTDGDSWGYWFPKNNPEILFNFKNEPSMLLREVDPDWYTQYNNGLLGYAAETEAALSITGKEHFAGVDIRGGGSYIVGTWDHDLNMMHDVTPLNSRIFVKDWLTERGIPIPPSYRTYRVSTDPSIPMCFDKENGIINYNYLSPFLIHPDKYKKKTPPRIINYILRHVSGDDVETTRWVLNWLAYVVQLKRVSGKALLLSGTQGTGKGLLYNRILRPLLGEHAPRITGLTPLEKEFNGWMEGALLVFVDEVDITAQKHGSSTVIQNLKQYITDPTVSIRRMRRDPYTIPNRCNFILASNRFDSLIIEDADRRFMVPPRQEQPITDGIKKDLGLKAGLELEIAIDKEVRAFAGFLMHYDVDHEFAQTIHVTEERTRLMEQQKDSGQLIARTIRTGNLTQLLGLLMEEYPSGMAHSSKLDTDFVDGNPPSIFAELCIQHALTNKPMNIARNDLERMFRALMRREWSSRTAFSRYLSARHNLLVKPVSVEGRTVVGLYNVTWTVQRTMAEAFRKWAKLAGDSSNVVPIKSRRKV